MTVCKGDGALSRFIGSQVNSGDASTHTEPTRHAANEQRYLRIAA